MNLHRMGYHVWEWLGSVCCLCCVVFCDGCGCSPSLSDSEDASSGELVLLAETTLRDNGVREVECNIMNYTTRPVILDIPVNWLMSVEDDAGQWRGRVEPVSGFFGPTPHHHAFRALIITPSEKRLTDPVNSYGYRVQLRFDNINPSPSLVERTPARWLVVEAVFTTISFEKYGKLRYEHRNLSKRLPLPEGWIK